MTEKTILWLGSSRNDMQAFPQDARRFAGFQLRLVQQGLEPLDWKPMPSIGLGVREIRIHTAVEHRVCYVAKFAEAIYVLHAFEKRTRKTLQRDVELARQRYQDLVVRRER
ncbi:MAG: type II toxin-antitoxin system RelE/ParE family toxin [Nitrospira defluvii]|nr:type II toxin-antitoxin system RelE/ParE family toxin [Nitrospira defluvii]